jgi:hypothetical protein
MARSAHRRGVSTKLALHRPHSHAKPIIIKTTKLVKPKHHRRHSGGGGGAFGRGLMDKKRLGIIIGGAAVGFLQHSQLKVPELPLLGEAGTIGVAAYFLSNNGRNKLADEICTAALTVAAYEFGAKAGNKTDTKTAEPTTTTTGYPEDPFGQGFVTGV